MFQAAIEIDGPFWNEGLAAHLRQLCSITAAGAGADLPPDEFAIEWGIGAAGEAPPANELPPAEGLELFAARYGLDVEVIRDG